jgi:formamidopyrimidine-DNA glycosylase
MPELPEVELVARYLRPFLLGRRILRVETTAPSYFFLSSPQLLKKALPHRSIISLERVGKYLLLTLDNHEVLLLHLGMTGQLIVDSANNPRLLHAPQKAQRDTRSGAGFSPDRHTHVRIYFDDGGKALYFRDTRKFGKIRLLGRGETDPRIDKLGPDALTLRAETLVNAARKRRTTVKTLLLDQSVIAGIGNIYADEALFLAHVHPQRPASSLSEEECECLATEVRRILRTSIRAGGSSIDDYVHPDGSDGQFQNRFNVYGRTNEPCHRCNTPIERALVGQRGTHYCPQCQPREQPKKRHPRP